MGRSGRCYGANEGVHPSARHDAQETGTTASQPETGGQTAHESDAIIPPQLVVALEATLTARLGKAVTVQDARKIIAARR